MKTTHADGQERRAAARGRKAAEFVMTLSEADMLAFVPQQGGIANVACPNCEGGRPNLANWDWTPQDPGHLTCKNCGERYPGNPKYPDDERVTVQAPDGEHVYPFFKPEDDVRLFFRAKAHYFSREFITSACQGFGDLFWETKDEKYARRAALILLRCAEVYPGYAYHYQYPGRKTRFAPYTQNRIPGVGAYRTTRWTGWAYEDVDRALLWAYDRVRFWPGLDQLGNGKARGMIEEDLFAAMVGFVIGFEEQYTNMSPTMWRSILYAGRVLGRPEWIQEVVARISRFADTRFLYDGYWMETCPSYAAQTVGNLEYTLRELDGYAPPESTQEEVKAAIIEGVAKARAVCRATRRGIVGLLLPNGTDPPVNDTWANNHRQSRNITDSLLLPGLGMAVLGGGEGAHQTYAWLNFTGGRHHKHYDALSIGLFAHDNELLRDIGYTHSFGRTWANCMMSHNTVVVNGLDSTHDRNHEKHRVRMFVTDRKGFHLVEAESDAAYPGITRRFRRTLLLVGGDSRDCYLIDVFQIRGGDQHDYLLHGSAAEDSAMSVTGVALEPCSDSLMNPGTHFVFPKWETPKEGDFGSGKGGGYGFVRTLSRGHASAVTRLDVRLASKPDTGVRSHLVSSDATTVFLGEAPSVRRAEGNGDLFHRFQAPVFCARRQGRDLTSVFIAVHEPVNGVPKVAGVTSEAIPGGFLLTVERAGRARDTFAMAFDDPISVTRDLAGTALGFNGVLGLIRTVDGTCVEAHLVGGESLTFGGVELGGVTGWRGLVANVHRRNDENSRGYFDVGEAIPADAAHGALILEFPDQTVRAYNVSRIEAGDTGTRVHVTEDPGYVVTDKGVELVTYPQRVISGADVRYWLPAWASFVRAGSGTGPL